MSNHILDYWDKNLPSPRNQQIEALEWIEQNKDKKYFILEAPVGSGKSLIGFTACSYFSSLDPNGKGGFILTPQKILQDQYMDDISKYNLQDKAITIFGKENYHCDKTGLDCKLSNLINEGCGANCIYEIDLEIAANRDVVITNYNKMISEIQVVGKTDGVFSFREVMVHDEAHVLESVITESYAVAITEATCKKYQIEFKAPETALEALEWISVSVMPQLEKTAEELGYICREMLKHGNKDIDTFIQLKEVGELLVALDGIIPLKNDIEKVFVYIKTDESIKFKPIYASSYSKYLFDKANKHVFMSGTILDKETFCSTLGIPEEETCFLRLDSDFPSKNRRLIYAPITKMNYTWKHDNRAEDREKMLSAIIKICENHSGNKGIIHSGNYEISAWLVENLRDKISQKIYYHENADDRKLVVNQFLNDEQQSVIVSPSLTEGIDLKDNLSRFGIIVKIPFPNLGDEWIKRKKKS